MNWLNKLKSGIAWVLVILLPVLCGCSDGGTDVGSITESFAESQTVSTESLDVSASESSADDSSVIVDEHGKDEKEIISLIKRDIELTQLFVYGDIVSGINSDYKYYSLDKENEFYDFSAVEDALSAVYSKDSKIAEKYLSYPTAAGAIIKSKRGVTTVCLAYVPKKDVTPLAETAVVSVSDGDIASATVTCDDGSSFTYSFVREDKHWRTSSCFFFDRLEESLKPGEIKGQSGRGEGSAKSLNGNCFVLNVFIDEKQSSWNNGKIETVLGYMEQAASFLESEGRRYGAQLSVTSSDRTQSAYLITSTKIPSDMSDFCWVEMLFSSTVYGTLENYAKSFFKAEEYDNWCVMLHIAKSGRSYALSCDSDYSDYRVYYAERAVMYYSEDPTYQYRSVVGTYAHEMLHLFGASDLYGDGITEDALQMLKHFFPNAIMHTVSNDLGMQGICPYNAYRVGWYKVPPMPFDKIKTEK